MPIIDLLSIQPRELQFSFEPKKQLSCLLQLVNQTQNHVAFKIKTTAPGKYLVRPNTGIILPGATCDVTVTMQAQRKAPPNMESKDKFLVQSIVVPDGAQQEDVSQALFNKAPGKEVNERKLRVVYMPPSPVPELVEEEDGFGPAANATISGERNGMAMQPKPTSGFSFLFVLLVGLLGILVGYFLQVEILGF